MLPKALEFAVQSSHADTDIGMCQRNPDHLPVAATVELQVVSKSTAPSRKETIFDKHALKDIDKVQPFISDAQTMQQPSWSTGPHIHCAHLTQSIRECMAHHFPKQGGAETQQSHHR